MATSAGGMGAVVDAMMPAKAGRPTKLDDFVTKRVFPQEGSRVTLEGCIVASAHPQSAGGIAIVALTFAERNPGAVTWSE
jgi:hypothetical protein